MFRHALCSAIVFTSILAGSSAALAENRLALVIGESTYRAVIPLPNPANDARAMSRMLGDAGFEVTTAADLSQKEMNEKWRLRRQDRGERPRYGGAGVLCRPWLADRRRELSGASRCRSEARGRHSVAGGAPERHPEHADSVPSKMRILLLDACRNNPFPAINKSAGHGLAIVDAKTGAPGTFMSFSTSPGAEAEDGSGTDSPYTSALLSTSPRSRGFRSRMPSSACASRSTRRPTGARRPGTLRR